MNLELIAGALENAGVGTQGKDIFVNFVPNGVMGILLREGIGGTKLQHDLPGYIKGRFSVVVRCQDYTVGKQVTKDAVRALTFTGETDLDGTQFQYMRPQTLPFVFSPSDGLVTEFLVNMDCCYVDLDA